MKIKYFLKLKMEAGYTIIETMVAISLFLVVIMYGTAALLNVNLLQKKSGDMRSIMDNLSFIMEDMSRNLRIGYDYHCVQSANPTPAELSDPQSCASGAAIAFEHSQGGNQDDLNDQWIYSISSGSIYKSTTGISDLSAFQPLISSDVVIDQAASSFSVLGAETLSNGDEQQPLVTIRLVGTITTKGVVSPFSLQTSVSQRLIDN